MPCNKLSSFQKECGTKLEESSPAGHVEGPPARGTLLGSQAGARAAGGLESKNHRLAALVPCQLPPHSRRGVSGRAHHPSPACYPRHGASSLVLLGARIQPQALTVLPSCCDLLEKALSGNSFLCRPAQWREDMAVHFLAKPWLPGIGHLVRVVAGRHPDWRGYFDSTNSAFSEPIS